MRATRDGSVCTSVLTCASQVFKPILVIALIGQVLNSVSSMPQRSNLYFPSSTHQNPGKNQESNLVVPVLTPNGFGSSSPSPGNPSSVNNGFVAEKPSIFEEGTTGIECDRPGDFVMAPDGCNSCLCAANRQLSQACSRAFCPPGFPSATQGQFNA